MRKWAIFLVIALMAFSATDGFSERLVLTSSYIEGTLPKDDPHSKVWAKAEPVSISLGAQVVYKPRIFKTNIRQVTARSLNNGQEIAFLLEWDDPTKDNKISNVTAFQDAVALQFPVIQEKNPHFTMGESDNLVNIWQWKAYEQQDLNGSEDRKKDYLTTWGVTWDVKDLVLELAEARTVEDLNAEGFGTLTSQPENAQNISGKGVWQNEKWRVVFARAMQSQDKEDVQFKQGTGMRVAFAVWDGENSEKDGQKSVSSWHQLSVEGAEKVTIATLPSSIN